MGTVYDGIEDARVDIDAACSPEDVANALNDLVSLVEEVREQYESNRENMPEQLQDAGTGAEMQEKIDALEEFGSSLEDAANDASSAEFEDEAGEESDEYTEWLLNEVIQPASSALDGLNI